jgi:thiamine-monophosphate kinase
VINLSKITGELDLIDQIRRDFSLKTKAVRQGIGDDCAILRVQTGSEVVVTTDFTIEGRHFRRSVHPPESVGHRCLARGLSDLAAMGATPVAAFLSLALPASMLMEASGRAWIERFFKGLRTLAEFHTVPLAGGDTSESPGGKAGLILADIVLVGSAPKGKALRRAGASVGDELYVTGYLGGAAAELATVLRSTRAVRATSSESEDHPHLFPIPRLDVGEALLRRGLATACMDISDGLSTDLAHLCQASGVRAEVEEAALPIHPLARKLGAASALQAALHEGEDYELLFTAPASVRLPSSLAGVPITRIGSITKRRAGRSRVTLLQADGQRTSLEPGGWQHFSAPAKTTRTTSKRKR